MLRDEHGECLACVWGNHTQIINESTIGRAVTFCRVAIQEYEGTIQLSMPKDSSISIGNTPLTAPILTWYALCGTVVHTIALLPSTGSTTVGSPSAVCRMPLTYCNRVSWAFMAFSPDWQPVGGSPLLQCTTNSTSFYRNDYNEGRKAAKANHRDYCWRTTTNGCDHQHLAPHPLQSCASGRVGGLDSSGSGCHYDKVMDCFITASSR